MQTFHPAIGIEEGRRHFQITGDLQRDNYSNLCAGGLHQSSIFCAWLRLKAVRVNYQVRTIVSWEWVVQKQETLKKGQGTQQHEGSSPQDQQQPELSFVDRQELTALNHERDVARD